MRSCTRGMCVPTTGTICARNHVARHPAVSARMSASNFGTSVTALDLSFSPLVGNATAPRPPCLLTALLRSRFVQDCEHPSHNLPKCVKADFPKPLTLASAGGAPGFVSLHFQGCCRHVGARTCQRSSRRTRQAWIRVPTVRSRSPDLPNHKPTPLPRPRSPLRLVLERRLARSARGRAHRRG